MKIIRKFIKNNHKLIIVAALAGLAAFVIFVSEVLYLRSAHSTFENYYAFRGCAQLVKKTDTYGICRLASGKEIKIVKFDKRWFLDGDLPCGFLCF